MSDWGSAAFGAQWNEKPTSGGEVAAAVAAALANLAKGMTSTTNVNYYGGGGGGGGGGASKKERAANLAAQLADRVKQLGLTTWSEKQIAKLAKDAIDKNWDETVITDNLLKSIEWDNLTNGDLKAGVDMIKALGGNYVIPITDADARSMAERAARGELTQLGIQNTLQTQAKARFTWMADLIDQGVMPKDYFAPIRNVIAQTLEVTPDSVNLLDQQWMDMIEVADTTTGKTRAATMNEAMLKARQRPEWSKTRQAQDQMGQMAQRLGKMFGRAA